MAGRVIIIVALALSVLVAVAVTAYRTDVGHVIGEQLR